jgi:hypothetical protein
MGFMTQQLFYLLTKPHNYIMAAFVRSVIDWDSSLLTFAVQILTLPILTFQLAKNHNLLETLFEVTHHAINMTMELTHAPVALSDGRFDASAYLVAVRVSLIEPAFRASQR